VELDEALPTLWRHGAKLMAGLGRQDILSEILFGLIMVLTFTLGASVAAGEDVEWGRTLILGAIGCNVAWGVIDATFYVMGELHARSRKARLLRVLHATGSEAAGLASIRRELDPQLEAIASGDDREKLYRSIYRVLEHTVPKPTRIHRADIIAAIAVFLLVAGTAIPAAVPFFFIDDPWVALRISNTILIGLLFLVGHQWASYAEANPWLVASCLTAIGIVLVVIAIALGG
jgi:VIT1/CCC1 family predicted Fe2+/Mn2+ transporter